MSYPAKICIGCGKEYIPVRFDQKFCCKTCRDKYHNLNKKGDICKACNCSLRTETGLAIICSMTGKVVIGKSGKGTRNAAKCGHAATNR